MNFLKGHSFIWFFIAFIMLISQPILGTAKDVEPGSDEELVELFAVVVNSPIIKMPNGSYRTAIGTVLPTGNGNYSTRLGELIRLQGGNYLTPFGMFFNDGEHGFSSVFGPIVYLGHGNYSTPVGIAHITYPKKHAPSILRKNSPPGMFFNIGPAGPTGKSGHL